VSQPDERDSASTTSPFGPTVASDNPSQRGDVGQAVFCIGLLADYGIRLGSRAASSSRFAVPVLFIAL
jgi:hypothetical protein